MLYWEEGCVKIKNRIVDMAAVNNSQRIYEKHMVLASKKCSEEATFDINIFSNIMKEIHTSLRREQQIIYDYDDSYYTLRDKDLITPIDTDAYQHLPNIFFNNLDSIFDYIEKFLQSRKKPTSHPFIKMCKNNTVACNQLHNKPCKYCFRFNANIKGIKMTNKFLNKTTGVQNAYTSIKPLEQQQKIKELQLHILNKKIRDAYRTLGNFFTADLFSIITKLPFDEYAITSKFMFRERHDRNSKPTMGYITYGLSITHTLPYTSNLIINYIKTHIWNKENITEKDCYMIHWLLAIACPFLRGSASFAKVMLNAALLRCELHPVKETTYYFKQTDWVAIFSPTFDEYYAKKDDMFEKDTMFQEYLVQPGGYRKKTRITRKKHRKYIK